MFAIEVDTCEVSGVSGDIKSLGHSNDCKKINKRKMETSLISHINLMRTDKSVA